MSLNIEDQCAIDAAKVCADLAQVTAALDHSALSPAEEQHGTLITIVHRIMSLIILLLSQISYLIERPKLALSSNDVFPS
jgi:hypothetical protein